jgi:hypothetical protein
MIARLVVGCTLTRASRRLQKKQLPRRLPSPATERARDLQKARKQGTLYFRFRVGSPNRIPDPARASGAVMILFSLQG